MRYADFCIACSHITGIPNSTSTVNNLLSVLVE